MAPSTARWSMDRVSVMVVAIVTWVAAYDGLADSFADGEDGSLRRVDDGGELADAVDAEVADGEGTAGQLVRGELAGPCPGGQVVCLAGDLGQGLAVGVADNGDDEPVVDGDRDADADVAVPQDAGLVPGDVDLRVGGQRRRAGPGEQVGDGDLEVRAMPLVSLGAEGEQVVRGEDDGQVEVRASRALAASRCAVRRRTVVSGISFSPVGRQAEGDGVGAAVNGRQVTTFDPGRVVGTVPVRTAAGAVAASAAAAAAPSARPNPARAAAARVVRTWGRRVPGAVRCLARNEDRGCISSATPRRPTSATSRSRSS